jgi:hypothetical protein
MRCWQRTDAQEMSVKRTIWIVAAAVAVLAVAGYWYLSRAGGDSVSVDLVEAFRGAEKRSNLAATSAFSMDPQTIQGVTRPAVYMHPSSRVRYKGVSIPERAHLRAYLALKEDAWDKGSDGVWFSIGISADGVYEEIVQQQVDPYHNPADRAWVAIDRDLSKWAGKQVEVVFNTRPSRPGHQPNDLFDFAVIGEPAIVVVTGS